MNIYFAASMRGAKPDTATYSKIIEELSNYGKVLTEHVGKPHDEADTEGLSDQEIYETDMTWLMDSDMLIAEVTQPSIGVGYEIGVAEALEKPVLCLFDKSSSRRRSAMLASQDIQHIEYSDLDDLIRQLQRYFKS